MNYIGKVARRVTVAGKRVRQVMLAHFTLSDPSPAPREALLDAVTARTGQDARKQGIEACWCLSVAKIPVSESGYWWQWHEFRLDELTPKMIADIMERGAKAKQACIDGA